MEFLVGEDASDLYRIPEDSGFRSVRLYSAEGLADPGTTYTFLVAYIAPYGSNSLHKHSVAEMMYVVSGYGKTRVGDDAGKIGIGSLIHAPADLLHQVSNHSPETMKLVCSFYPALPKKELDAILGHPEENGNAR